jgi:hypothetical protein
MELGPIAGVRAVALINPVRFENSAPQAFVIDPSARAGDDACTEGHRAPDRGLEEEETSSDGEGEVASDAIVFSTSRSAKISYFA